MAFVGLVLLSAIIVAYIILKPSEIMSMSENIIKLYDYDKLFELYNYQTLTKPVYLSQVIYKPNTGALR